MSLSCTKCRKIFQIPCRQEGSIDIYCKKCKKKKRNIPTWCVKCNKPFCWGDINVSLKEDPLCDKCIIKN